MEGTRRWVRRRAVQNSKAINSFKICGQALFLIFLFLGGKADEREEST